MMSKTPPMDSIQQTLPAARETSNSTPVKGISLLLTEEEVANKASEGTFYPSREEGAAERGSEGSSHYDMEEEIVETFLSPKDRGSFVNLTLCIEGMIT